jgi:hypothetical protein
MPGNIKTVRSFIPTPSPASTGLSIGDNLADLSDHPK